MSQLVDSIILTNSEMIGMIYRNSIIFQNLFCITNVSTRASNAPVSTRLYAHDHSIIIGPTVYTTNRSCGFGTSGYIRYSCAGGCLPQLEFPISACRCQCPCECGSVSKEHMYVYDDCSNLVEKSSCCIGLERVLAKEICTVLQGYRHYLTHHTLML